MENYWSRTFYRKLAKALGKGLFYVDSYDAANISTDTRLKISSEQIYKVFTFVIKLTNIVIPTSVCLSVFKAVLLSSLFIWFITENQYWLNCDPLLCQYCVHRKNFDEIPKLLKYWLYIGNICDETQI